MLESIMTFIESILNLVGIDPATMSIVEKVFEFISSLFAA